MYPAERLLSDKSLKGFNSESKFAECLAATHLKMKGSCATFKLLTSLIFELKLRRPLRKGSASLFI